MTISISLPAPPSVNNLFANIPGRGRVKSSRYSAWLREASAMILQQRPGRIGGPYRVEIEATRKDKRRRDIDGIIKPLVDCLVTCGITPDDSLMQSVTAAWVADGEGVRVTVRAAE